MCFRRAGILGWLRIRGAAEGLEDVDCTVRDVAVEDVRIRSATVRVDLDVYNPNPIDVIVEDMDLCFYANERCVIRSHNVSRATIPPYEKRPLLVKSDVSHLDSADALAELVRHGPGQYQLRGVIRLQSALGEIPYDFKLP